MKYVLTGLALLLFAVLPAVSQDKPTLSIEDPTETIPITYTILGIDVTGVARNEAFILATAGLEEGMKIQIPGPKISNAINTLHKTGLFTDIQLFITQRVSNGVFLELALREQPRLQIYEFQNIKRSERTDLKDGFPLLPGFAVTDAGKSQAVQTIKRFYRAKGYRNTEVTIIEQLADTARNRVKLIFDIDKGELLELKRVRFVGNDTYDDAQLRKAMKEVKQDAWWRLFSKTVFKREDLETSKDNLATYYGKNGFRDYRWISDSVYVYEFEKGKYALGLDIKVFEGPQYIVRNITWEGNTVYTDEQLDISLGFSKGDQFDNVKFEQNLYFNEKSSDVSSLYQDVGYLFFQVQPTIKNIGRDSIDIHLSIAEDEIATVKEVGFSGNTRTHDNVVRRNLRTIPGNKYSRSNIQRSIRELATLSYFAPESITPELDYDYEKKTVSIFYSMNELSGTDNFEFSGGYGGAGLGLILSARLNFNNFSLQNINKKDAWTPLPSGDGQKFSLGVQITGGGFQSYDISFQEPWLLGRPNSLGVNGSYSLFRFNQTREELFSASVSYGRRLKWPDDYFTHTSVLQYQAFDVSQSFFNDSGNFYVLTLRQVLERNSYDNFIAPNTGSRFTLTGEVAPPVLGMAQYYKMQFRYNYNIPLIGKLVFSNGSEFGHIGYFGVGDRSPFERFFLGGTPLQQRQTFTRDNVDLRGYPGGINGSISPLNSQGNPTGGTYYVKYTSEIRYPAVANEQLQLIPYLFAEGGNAYNGFRNVAPFNIKRSAGMGVRLFLPILGLIDLSYGYRFDGIENTDIRPGNWEFLFNIGPSF